MRFMTNWQHKGKRADRRFLADRSNPNADLILEARKLTVPAIYRTSPLNNFALNADAYEAVNPSVPFRDDSEWGDSSAAAVSEDSITGAAGDQVSESGAVSNQLDGPIFSPTSNTNLVKTTVSHQNSDSVVVPGATAPVAVVPLAAWTSASGARTWDIANDIGGGVKSGTISGTLSIHFSANFTGPAANFDAEAGLNLNSTFMNVTIGEAAGAVITDASGTVLASNPTFEQGGSIAYTLNIPLPNVTDLTINEAYASQLLSGPTPLLAAFDHTTQGETPAFDWTFQMTVSP